MTRDECLRAIGAAFDNAPVWASAGTWICHVDSSPRRDILLSPTFVNRNIFCAGLAPAELTAMLRRVAVDRWRTRTDGVRTLSLG